MTWYLYNLEINLRQRKKLSEAKNWQMLKAPPLISRTEISRYLIKNFFKYFFEHINALLEDREMKVQGIRGGAFSLR